MKFFSYWKALGQACKEHNEAYYKKAKLKKISQEIANAESLISNVRKASPGLVSKLEKKLDGLKKEMEAKYRAP